MVLAGRFGGAEGGGGVGTGDGGLCANVTGTRRAIAIAGTTNLRKPWLIDRCLKRKSQCQNPSRTSVPVKVPGSNNRTAQVYASVPPDVADSNLVEVCG